MLPSLLPVTFVRRFTHQFPYVWRHDLRAIYFRKHEQITEGCRTVQGDLEKIQDEPIRVAILSPLVTSRYAFNVTVGAVYYAPVIGNACPENPHLQSSPKFLPW